MTPGTNVSNDGIRCMVMRGGTSKGAYFDREDLPDDSQSRDEVLLRIMGTPDPRQIDGLGGAHPLTSKVAVVCPSDDDRADIDYLFLQVGVDDRLVTDRQNCGNILAGVGPFALERGMVTAVGSEASVRIRMLNSHSIAVARFPIEGGLPRYSGDTAIAGVPGTSAPVRIEFEDIAGSITGSLLPSGSSVDIIEGVACTLIDNGMPVVVMPAADLGVSGYEDCPALEANLPLRQLLERIRLAASGLMGIDNPEGSTIPKLTIVSPPRKGGALSTRTFIPHRCHDAIGVLGAVSVATAAMLQDTPAAAVADMTGAPEVVLEHPTGSFTAVVEITTTGGTATTRAGIIRTARKIMDGLVFPRSYE